MDFKYLVNPNAFPFTFQHNSEIYEVPAESELLLPSEVAEHGEKRSMALSNPKVGPDGSVLHAGNDVYRYCHTRDAKVVNPVGLASPVVVEESKAQVASAEELSLKPPSSLGAESPPPHPMRAGDMPKAKGPVGNVAPKGRPPKLEDLMDMGTDEK